MNILDSSAYLALLFHEKGYEVIEKLALESLQKKETIFMHQINFIEVIYKTINRISVQAGDKVLEDFCCPWWGKINYLDTDSMLLSSQLKAKYNHASLADCLGLATTKVLKGTFWTADKLLAEIGHFENISVELIR